MVRILLILTLFIFIIRFNYGQKDVQQDFQFAEEELKPSSQIKSFQKINDLEGIDNHGKARHPAYKAFIKSWEKNKPEILTPSYIDSLIRVNDTYVEFEESFWAKEEKENIEALSVINQQILLAKKMTTLGKLIFAGIVLKQLSYNKITRSNEAIIGAAGRGDPLFFSEMLIFMKLIPLKYKHVHNDKLFVKLCEYASVSRIIEFSILATEKENKYLYQLLKDSYAIEMAEKNNYLDVFIDGLKEIIGSKKKKDINNVISNYYKPYERYVTKFSLLQDRKSVNYKINRLQFDGFLHLVNKYPNEFRVLKKEKVFSLCIDYHLEQLFVGYKKNKLIFNDVKNLKLFIRLCKDPFSNISEFIFSINKHKGTFDLVHSDKIFMNGMEIQTLEESLSAIENYFVTYKRIKEEDKFIKLAKVKKLEPILSQAEMKEEIKANESIKSQSSNN